MTTHTAISLFAPAKINLLLAVTGTRADGFHALTSLVAPISLGDTLHGTLSDAEKDSLKCSVPGVPTDNSNLVLRASELFRENVPACPPIDWTLEKRVPHGAGLGGGSSDAAAALKILNSFCDNVLTPEKLHSLASRLGSDVPLFLNNAPVIMRGRGELIEALPASAIAALHRLRFLLFKPAFGVSTADAYRAMKQNAPHDYVSEENAETLLHDWLSAPEKNSVPLFNNMERAVFRKHLALPTLFSVLRERHRISSHMSGSGSACFAQIQPETDVPAITRTIRAAWGESAFICPVQIASPRS